MPKEKDKIRDTASASCLSYILEGTSFYFFLTTAMLILFARYPHQPITSLRMILSFEKLSPAG